MRRWAWVNPGGPSVVTRVLVRGRRGGGAVRERGELTMESEVGVMSLMVRGQRPRNVGASRSRRGQEVDFLLEPALPTPGLEPLEAHLRL